MCQIFVSIFTLLLATAIAFGLDPRTKAEIDELIAFVQTSDVRFVRNGREYSAPESAQHLRDKLGMAGDRVKTTDDFITGIATKSYLSGKPYMVKFPDGPHSPLAIGCERIWPRCGRTNSESRHFQNRLPSRLLRI